MYNLTKKMNRGSILLNSLWVHGKISTWEYLNRFVSIDIKPQCDSTIDSRLPNQQYDIDVTSLMPHRYAEGRSKHKNGHRKKLKDAGPQDGSVESAVRRRTQREKHAGYMNWGTANVA